MPVPQPFMSGPASTPYMPQVFHRDVVSLEFLRDNFSLVYVLGSGTKLSDGYSLRSRRRNGYGTTTYGPTQFTSL